MSHILRGCDLDCLPRFAVVKVFICSAGKVHYLGSPLAELELFKQDPHGGRSLLENARISLSRALSGPRGGTTPSKFFSAERYRPVHKIPVNIGQLVIALRLKILPVEIRITGFGQNCRYRIAQQIRLERCEEVFYIDSIVAAFRKLSPFKVQKFIRGNIVRQRSSPPLPSTSREKRYNGRQRYLCR